MPKSDPASLSPQEYSQLVAYILKINNVPPGKTDLPTDAGKLKSIKIAMPAPNAGKNEVKSATRPLVKEDFVCRIV